MVTATLEALRAMAADGGRGVHVTSLESGETAVLDEAATVIVGARPPDEVMAASPEVMAAGTPRVIEVDGETWFVEPVLPPPRLLVFGAIAVADALVPMAAAAGFEVIVVDPRPWLATPERHPDAGAVHCGEPADIMGELEIDGSTAVVSFLHEARLEDPVLVAALEGPASYVGAMGSRRTTAAKRERLLAAGLDEDVVERLHAPIGLDVGALTPEEIAVAVLAEIVAVRRGVV